MLKADIRGQSEQALVKTGAQESAIDQDRFLEIKGRLDIPELSVAGLNGKKAFGEKKRGRRRVLLPLQIQEKILPQQCIGVPKRTANMIPGMDFLRTSGGVTNMIKSFIYVLCRNGFDGVSTRQHQRSQESYGPMTKRIHDEKRSKTVGHQSVKPQTRLLEVEPTMMKRRAIAQTSRSLKNTERKSTRAALKIREKRESEPTPSHLAAGEQLRRRRVSRAAGLDSPASIWTSTRSHIKQLHFFQLGSIFVQDLS